MTSISTCGTPSDSVRSLTERRPSNAHANSTLRCSSGRQSFSCSSKRKRASATCLASHEGELETDVPRRLLVRDVLDEASLERDPGVEVEAGSEPEVPGEPGEAIDVRHQPAGHRRLRDQGETPLDPPLGVPKAMGSRLGINDALGLRVALIGEAGARPQVPRPRPSRAAELQPDADSARVERPRARRQHQAQRESGPTRAGPAREGPEAIGLEVAQARARSLEPEECSVQSATFNAEAIAQVERAVVVGQAQGFDEPVESVDHMVQDPSTPPAQRHAHSHVDPASQPVPHLQVQGEVLAVDEKAALGQALPFGLVVEGEIVAPVDARSEEPTAGERVGRDRRKGEAVLGEQELVAHAAWPVKRRLLREGGRGGREGAEEVDGPPHSDTVSARSASDAAASTAGVSYPPKHTQEPRPVTASIAPRAAARPRGSPRGSAKATAAATAAAGIARSAASCPAAKPAPASKRSSPAPRTASVAPRSRARRPIRSGRSGAEAPEAMRGAPTSRKPPRLASSAT